MKTPPSTPDNQGQFAPAHGSALWRDLEQNELPLAGDEAWNGELKRWEAVSIPSMWLAGGRRIEGVEFHVEPFFARLARVDGGADFLDRGRHGGVGVGFALHAEPLLFFRPKNTQPFQRVPVMARAMAESD